jgi:hypothetical protein
MVEGTKSLRPRVAQTVTCFSAVVLLLFWNTGAYAQSREDQYGPPTGPVDHVNRASDVLNVLPDTGGPLILLVGVALVVVGAGMALVGRQNGRK